MSDSPDRKFLAELYEMVRDLGTELGKVPDQLAELKSDLKDELTALRTDVMARIDRLQDAMTRQREFDVVNFSAGERAEKIAKDARAACRRKPAAWASRCRRL